jgi:GNAT superfamily N-acetyltransferase
MSTPARSEPIIRRLHDTAGDVGLLREAYGRLYRPQFPDPNERESLDNILESLRAAPEGDDRYSVGVAEADGGVTGLIISDFLAAPRAGVIEFVVVDPGARRCGLGGRLVDWAERQAREHCDAAGLGDLTAMVAELEDPLLVGETGGQDPVARAAWWARRGFQALDFPYVQPSLSPAQRPVRHLLLMARTGCADLRESVPPDWVASLVTAYARFAMRRDEPERDPSVAEMLAWLGRQRDVGWTALEPYLGRSQNA